MQERSSFWKIEVLIWEERMEIGLEFEMVVWMIVIERRQGMGNGLVVDDDCGYLVIAATGGFSLHIS